MVRIRNQRRVSRSLRRAETSSIRTEQNVRGNHDCSGDEQADILVGDEENRSSHPEEQGRHHELEREVLNVVGERQELPVTDTQALSVNPATADAMASPIDHVKSERALTDSTTREPMSPTLEVYINCPRVDVQPEQGLGMDIEQLELQRPGVGPSRPGLIRLPDFVFPEGDTKWPGVPEDDTSDDDDGEDDEDDSLDPDWTIPEGEGATLPSRKSGRVRPACEDKKMSEIMSTCRHLAANRNMKSGAELKKYLFGSAIASESHHKNRQGPRRIRREVAGSATLQIPEPSIVRAEVPSPPVVSTFKRRHFLRSSSTVNNDLDEDHPLRNPEGSLPHSLYLQVLAYGQEGVLLEDLLNCFHCQSLTAMLTDDWEDEVIDYLNRNPYFDQVEGHYLLSEFLVHPTPKRSAKGKEKVSPKGKDSKLPPGSTIGSNQDCGPKNREVNGVQGSSEDKQEKHGIQEGGRRCSLTVLKPKRKQWQCRMIAMEGQKYCEHHYKKRGPFPKVQPEAIALTNSKRLSKGKEKAPSNWRLPAREKEPIKRGPHSLQTMQAKIIAKHGIQEGGKLCAVKNSRSWRCPMMAMEGRAMCEHHYMQAKTWRNKKSL